MHNLHDSIMHMYFFGAWTLACIFLWCMHIHTQLRHKHSPRRQSNQITRAITRAIVGNAIAYMYIIMFLYKINDASTNKIYSAISTHAWHAYICSMGYPHIYMAMWKKVATCHAAYALYCNLSHFVVIMYVAIASCVCQRDLLSIAGPFLTMGIVVLYSCVLLSQFFAIK